MSTNSKASLQWLRYLGFVQLISISLFVPNIVSAENGRLPINEDRKNYVSSRFVSAYNVDIVGQTDDSPCIGASMIDLCKLANDNIIFFATNKEPLWSYLCVETVGCGYVLDRMNSRYENGEIDIGMSEKKLTDAKNFGRRKLKITSYDKR